MSSLRNTSIKVGIFGVVMLMLTAALFAIFSQYRAGPDTKYSAVFADASSLKAGDSVRVAGVRVGTVKAVDLQPDNSVVVGFGADRNIVLRPLTVNIEHRFAIAFPKGLQRGGLVTDFAVAARRVARELIRAGRK